MKAQVSALMLATLLSACGSPVVTSLTGPQKGESFANPAQPSTRPGMGANVYAGGVTFRVWAPNASAVSVAGDFNGWDDQATPLGAEGNGNFSLDVPGALAGQQYHYVIRRPGSTVTRQDPRSRDVTSSVGNSVIVDPSQYSWTATGFITPGFDQQVIYEMHIGTYNDTPGGAPGTFATAIAQLDHLSEIGINMVEILPPAEFPGDFSWGYNPSFPMAPESAYGSPDDARRFVDEAHARGIGVIVDVVHNHWGPNDLAMWCFDGDCLGDGNGGVYFYTDWRRESGWGPRPDYGRSEVRDYIVDAARTWLDEYHADGLRWDSTVNIRKANGTDIPEGWGLLQRANDSVDSISPWKIMIAEDLQNEPWITKPTSVGGAGFDSQWDAGFFHPVDDNIIKPSDADRDMNAIAGAIAHTYDGQATRRVIYTESHDEVANGKSRIPEMIDPGHADSYWSKKRSTLGAAIVFTSPGIPMIFQGQEFLENGYFTDQVPLDWTKTVTFAGIQQMYTDMIALRRNLGGNTRGLQGDHVNVFHVNDAAKVIAFHRWKNGGAGDDVVVVANFSSVAFPQYDLGFPRGGTWHVRFNSDWNGYDPAFSNTASNDLTANAGGMDGLGYHGTVGIGPYTAIVLSQ